jgi:competence protein ComEC
VSSDAVGQGRRDHAGRGGGARLNASGSIGRRATVLHRRGVVRSSISPLVWVGAAVWFASRAGTEIALHAWQESGPGLAWQGCVAVVALVIAALLTPRPVVRLAAAAAACAMAVALAHGVGLASTAANLDASGPRAWTGLVVADPRVTAFGTSITVRLDDAGGGATALLSWPDGVDPPAYGTVVGFDARLRAVVRGSAGAGDAFRSGELLRGTPWRVTSVAWAAGPFGAVGRWREGAVAAMRRIGGRGGPALASMVFAAPAVGEGVAALEDAKAAGVAWAITTSGLHLGVIVLLAERLASLLGAGRRGRAGAMAVALGVVSVAAGLRLSLLRAAIVAAAAAIGRLAGRRRDATAALGLAVVVLVSLDPAAAYDVGLLLGVAAVSAIALLAPLVKEWLAPLVGRTTARGLGVPVAAQASVLPLSAGLFGAVSLVGPLALVASVPAVGAAVVLGMAGAVSLPLIGPGASVVLRAAAGVANAATLVWQAAARVPGALVTVPLVPPWVVPAWIAGGAALWLWWPTPRRAARTRIGAAAILCVLAVFALVPHATTGCVEVLDVGQGDAILIRDGGQAVLVDTGPDPVVLRQALARAGVRDLDGVVLTHPHADHVGGLDGLSGITRPAWIAVPDVDDAAVMAVGSKAAGYAGRLVRLRRDMTFSVGRVTVRVLWPRGGEKGLSGNDTSVVLLLDLDGHKALLLGDAEERAQRGALEAWSGTVEMLKVAHHGSVNGDVPVALEQWKPKVALISVGRGNPFGHPAGSTLDELARIGARVRRTDLEGDLGWDPAAGSAASIADAVARLCDNLLRALPGTGAQASTDTDPWLPPTSATSSPSISSTAPRSCCSSAPRSVCSTVWRPSPISISTWRGSTAPRPPPTTWSTPRTPCRS